MVGPRNRATGQQYTAAYHALPHTPLIDDYRANHQTDTIALTTEYAQLNFSDLGLGRGSGRPDAAGVREMAQVQ